MRVGAVHFRGGMMMRMPLWRLPLMEPPRASTMKLTKNLRDEKCVRGGNNLQRKIDRSHTTDTSEEDNSHAVITVHPNKVRKREKITKTEKEQETERLKEELKML